MNATTLAAKIARARLTPKQKRVRTHPLPTSIPPRDDRTMPASARVHGPYPEGDRWRLIVVEGAARKSIKVTSLEEAERLRTELLKQIQTQSIRTVGEAIEEFLVFLERERGCKPVSIGKYRAIFQSFLPMSAPLSSLTAARAAALYQAETVRVGRYGKVMAVATQRTALKAAKGFSRWCKRRGYLREDPFVDVAPVGRVNTGKKQLRLDEARRLVTVALEGAQAGDRDAIGVLLMLLLGLRSGEFLARVAADVDDEGRVLWIPYGKTANARRRLAVPDVLQPLLRNLTHGLSPEDWLFGAKTNGDRRGSNVARFALRRYCKQAGISQVCPHSLRGLHATLAITAGATSHAVASALGHGSFAITARHYADPGAVSGAKTRTVVEALGATLDGPASQAPAERPAQPANNLEALLGSLSVEQVEKLRQLLDQKR